MSDENPITFEKAAAAMASCVGSKSLRRLCISRGVALRCGGSERKPRLKVLLSEARRVVRENVYVPRGATPRRPRQESIPASVRDDVRC